MVELGGREAIGVFLWGTDSSENQRVPQGVPTSLVSSPNSSPPGSSSSTTLRNISNVVLVNNVLETRERGYKNEE